MKHDDRQLLLATHRGHEASARLLWDRHGQRLRAHARAILRDSSAADDVVQAVMCRLLELPRVRLAEVDDAAAFLSASVRREAINYLRSMRRETARRRQRGADSCASSRAVEPDPGDSLTVALESLPRRLQEVIILKHSGSMTFDQISQVLATNRNTVAARYRSALESLRRILDPLALSQGAAHE